MKCLTLDVFVGKIDGYKESVLYACIALIVAVLYIFYIPILPWNAKFHYVPILNRA